MHCRLIEQSDIPILLEMARAMHQASPAYTNIPFVASAARTLFFKAVLKPDEWFCWVAEKEGEIVGAMMACRVPILFSDCYEAVEIGIYVRPEYRGTVAAMRLVVAFSYWARHCTRVTVSVSAGTENDQKVVRFYKKMGFTPRGAILWKER